MAFTLPPDESSDRKSHGHFEIALSTPEWTRTVSEPSHAHINFWGHSSSHDLVLAIPGNHSKMLASIPITVGVYHSVYVLTLMLYQ
jgi:hypothetical protein